MREPVLRQKFEKKIANGKRVDNFLEWDLLKNEKDVAKLNKAFPGKNYLTN